MVTILQSYKVTEVHLKFFSFLFFFTFTPDPTHTPLSHPLCMMGEEGRKGGPLSLLLEILWKAS